MDQRVSDDNAIAAGVPVTVLVHFYRGELTRMISWRDRLDRTTNWAIGALAAMLSISLASQEAHHSVLLFAMLLIHVLLMIEARRYRFFHVYRARVRLLEREYFAGLFEPNPGAASPDLASLAQALREPRFSITLLQAMSRRLQRNYCWLFVVVLLAWLVKTTSEISQGHTRLVHSVAEFLRNAGIAGIPGGVVVCGIVLLYAWLIFVMVHFDIAEDTLGPGQVHV
ncbi:MAG TPA: DUF2270 domain-containing protein [Steroidobacteraceae bacterium]|nr:DUF2270 domain-containing protein [Steroidobacteraceae bacterium]